MALSDIVNVQISRQTTAVTKAGFGIMQFLSTHRVFSELAREYSTTTAMVTDGFLASDPALQAATAYFAQTKNGTPTKIVIGRRACDVSHVTLKAMTAIGQTQTVTINGAPATFTSVTGAETAQAVATAMKTAIDLLSQPVTVVDLGVVATDAATDGIISITSTVADAGDTILVSSSAAAILPTLEHQAKNAAIITDVNAIQVINDNWYGLTTEEHNREFVRMTVVGVNAVETSGVSINGGTDIDYMPGVIETATATAVGLAAAINASTQPYIAKNNYDGTIDIYNDGSVSSNVIITVADSAANSNANAYAANGSPVIALATGIEALKKIYGASSNDATAIAVADATDIVSNAKLIDNANFARTFYIHDAEADSAFPEAAWMGHMFPTDPGSATWKFKTLATITSENLTETNRTNLLAKKGNIYLEVGGVDITCDGTVGEGEFIDVIRGVDWLDARLTERIFSRLVNLPKIAYTNQGVAVIEAEIRAQLDEAIVAGFIASDPANHNGQPYTISVPLVENVSANDKATRTLNNVTFQATLAGAIHAVTVNGVVTV